MVGKNRIVCDGPPGPESGRFVEVEDAGGQSIHLGEWKPFDVDGTTYWGLYIDDPRALTAERDALLNSYNNLSDDYMALATERDALRSRGIYSKAWETYGQDAQLLMLAEECSELAVAALHVVRGRKDAGGPSSNLAEELADVTNMIEQVVTQPGIGEEVARCRRVKLARLAERLERESKA